MLSNVMCNCEGKGTERKSLIKEYYQKYIPVFWIFSEGGKVGGSGLLK